MLIIKNLTPIHSDKISMSRSMIGIQTVIDKSAHLSNASLSTLRQPLPFYTDEISMSESKIGTQTDRQITDKQLVKIFIHMKLPCSEQE